MARALLALLAAATAHAAHAAHATHAAHHMEGGRERRGAPATIESASPPPGASPAPADNTELLPDGILEGGEADEWRDLWYSSLEAARREPALNTTEENVSAQIGSLAFLHCPVKHLGERGISWVRRRDWHIISSGLLMYTNDERFQVLHNEGAEDWILQIKYVVARDNGTYECQVSTRRGTLSRLAHLHVAVPEAFILGADEHYVDAGSTLSLVCIIEKSPEPPQYVFWYHNARMVNYDALHGVSVRTEPGPRTRSTLELRAARPDHSGNYTCRAANAQPAHIYVYVSEGSDKMAATLSRNLAPAHPPSAALGLANYLCACALLLSMQC